MHSMDKRLLLFIVLFLIPLSGIGTDLYTPSLPAIAHYFHISDMFSKLTMSTFLAGFAVGQLLFGTLSDTYGRKNMLLVGLGLFTLSSILSPFIPNIYALLTLRSLQGFGLGSPSSVCKSLLSDHFEGRALQNASTYLSVAWGLGPIVAPFIGGYLQHYFNWPSNFYFFTLYGVLSLILVSFFLKEPRIKRIPFNYQALRTNFLTIGSHRTFLGLILLMGIGYGILIVFNVIAPFLIQNDLKYSAITYGHLALIVGAAYFIGTLANRLLINFFRSKSLISMTVVATLIISIALLVMLYFVKMNLWTITVPVCALVFFEGIQFPNAMAITLNLFPDRSGMATAIMGTTFVLFAMVTSVIASALEPASQIPMAWLYASLAVLSLFIFVVFLRKKPC